MLERVEIKMKEKSKRVMWDIVGLLKWVAGICLTAMMLLTVFDVVLRFLRHPIPGTYEMVGFLGALFVSFSLAYTSIMGLHIAVDFLVRKLPRNVQKIIEVFDEGIGSLLFCILTWHFVKYGVDIKNSGEVSLTLQVPIYPFVFGVAVGCGVLSIVLIFRIKDIIMNRV